MPQEAQRATALPLPAEGPQVLKLGTVEMTDTWKEGDSTFVRIVTRPDFGNWVGAQGGAGPGRAGHAAGAWELSGG